MTSPRDNANLPQKKRTCPQCGSENLVLKKSATGEGPNRRVQNRIECGDCMHILAFV